MTPAEPAAIDPQPSPRSPVPADSQPVPADSSPVPADSQPVSTDNPPVSADSQPVPADSQPVSTHNPPVPADIQPVSTDNPPVPTDSSPVPADSPGLRALLRAEAPVLGPLALALLCTYAYFIGPPAWNQNSRLALTRALVEHRSPIIDDYHASTGDKSQRDGHFYSDKAPGASLLALPAYALFYAGTRLAGGELPEFRVVPLDPSAELAGQIPDADARAPGDRLAYNQAHRTALYLCRLLSTSLLAVAGVLALYLLARRQLLPGTTSRRPALLLALLYGLATPAFVYSTALYGHQPCADLLLLGLALTVLGESSTHPRSVAVLTGLCLGLAVVCEYPAAVPVALIFGFIAWRRGPRFAAWTALGGLPCALVLTAYHVAAFGHPLKTGYDFVYLAEFAEGMRVNYGIHAPRAAVTLELLFGRFRGLFYLAPVLILAAWGLVVDALRPAPRDMSKGAWPRRQLAWLALAIVGFYLALGSGYYMWDGGAAVGPRHCVPMLPFLALGLAPALRLVPGAVLALGAVSAAQMLAAAAAAPEAPQFGDPLWGHAWPHLLHSQPGYGGATNLGLLLGLPGILSVLPLLALWWWTWQQLRPQQPPG